MYTYLDEVPVCLTFFEQRRRLAHVRINPNTDAQSAVLQPLHVAPGIGKHVRVELKVAPLVRFHPETIEVEDAQRDISVSETVQEAGDGFLVVVRGET